MALAFPDEYIFLNIKSGYLIITRWGFRTGIMSLDNGYII